MICTFCFYFFFNDTATTEIYTLSLHDALPVSHSSSSASPSRPASSSGGAEPRRRSRNRERRLVKHERGDVPRRAPPLRPSVGSVAAAGGAVRLARARVLHGRARGRGLRRPGRAFLFQVRTPISSSEPRSSAASR